MVNWGNTAVCGIHGKRACVPLDVARPAAVGGDASMCVMHGEHACLPPNGGAMVRLAFGPGVPLVYSLGLVSFSIGIGM